MHNLNDFQNHGWLISEAGIAIERLMDPVASDSVLNFVKCNCTTGCDTKRYSCVKSALKCSEQFNCTKCENTASSDDDDVYDDGVDDYDEYEEDIIRGSFI